VSVQTTWPALCRQRPTTTTAAWRAVGRPEPPGAPGGKVLIRLARKQRDRVPVPPGRSREYVRPADWPAVPADPGA